MRAAKDSLSQLLSERVGFWNSGRVLVYIVAWGIAAEKLGHAPTVDEYSSFWKQSERTTYRELSAFRKGLPGETDPERIWSLVRDQVPTDRDIGPATLGTIRSAALKISAL